MGELESCPSPWAGLEMPGFGCAIICLCYATVDSHPGSVCVRMCKMKHGGTARVAQSMFMDQGWAPARTTFHLSCTEVPEAELTAEPRRSPPLPRIALTSAFNCTPLCTCSSAFLCLDDLGFFFLQPQREMASSLSTEAFSFQVVWIWTLQAEGRVWTQHCCFLTLCCYRGHCCFCPKYNSQNCFLCVSSL